ncbi:MAG: 1-acyl-sn-glycerol-3-phosphate acyltransferase [Ignavibacteria bacterium]|jgi:1-acyl-sn-glycerol-3-phosphate acyltransferase|nr:1-acyl-sn-glycerol-3-phosphate acyltransferase [Ignavibacteria bacterium]MCU7501603.1 1-acyl-sn-glycerol-3-phosphate acyltransferase [Ignavibacteria bacterium]MCU7517140.1 1-acyl-sn-glycerol-3-phosphate acyltransferase [Ignavibacteria bacterium]
MKLTEQSKPKYPRILAENDTYRTPQFKKEKVLLSPTLSFFPRLFNIVINSGRLAKQGKYGPEEWVQSSIDILDALESSGIKIEVSGMNYLSSFEGPAVFISNHMSTLETMILPSIIQPIKEVTFVVKQELINYPYFGHILGARDPIVVGRSNPREDLMHVMNEGLKYIKNGRSIIIFPQRTRSSRFNSEHFNTLGVKLAKKAGCYVVPTALVTDAWGNGRMIKDIGRIDPSKTVHFSFGKPLQVESTGAKEHLAVLDFIREKLTAWGREDCIEK